MTTKNKIIAITPFFCLIAFFLIGYFTKTYHPTWLVFLLIPLMPFIVGEKKIRFSIPLLIATTYVVASFLTGLWHPLWVMLFLIPVFHIVLTPTRDNIKND
ncbi:MAG: hypothetical protein PHP65_03930 [Bacilli bacterium]|nr:hypothetical protein [Bacilli bacterium]